MTNFEKFVNTFGFIPNTSSCITDNGCGLCPAWIKHNGCSTEDIEKWWHSEYKEKENNDRPVGCHNCKYRDQLRYMRPCLYCVKRTCNTNYKRGKSDIIENYWEPIEEGVG